jgi:hypothetical protein
MVEFSLVNLKVWLVCFKSYAVQSSWAKHHLWALHKIVHDVFKNWNQFFRINRKKVNFLICYHLKSSVSLNIINLSSHFWNFVIFSPFSGIFINFKEKNWVWRSNNQSLIKEKIHWSKIWICNFFTLKLFWILRTDGKSMALSVKCIAIICIRAIKRFYRKIENSSVFKFTDSNFTNHLAVLNWVYKVIMLHLNSVIDIYVQIIVNFIVLIARNESTCNEWFPKARKRLSFIVSMENIGDFHSFYILFSQINNAHVEYTIILVTNRNDITSLILLN